MPDNIGSYSNHLDPTDPFAAQRDTPHQQNPTRNDPVAKTDATYERMRSVIPCESERNAPPPLPAGALNPTPQSTARLVDFVKAETIEGNKHLFDTK
jgi:hypothetical protein